MRTSGLTMKNMANCRFKKTEYIIFLTYYKYKDYLSAKKLAMLSGISRSTLYRHHKNIQCIPTDYEKYLLQSYQIAIKSLIQKKCASTKSIYFRTLIFIVNNKETIKALFDDERKEIIKRMLDYLKSKIVAEWEIKGDVDKMYNIYKNEVLGCIELWGKHNFSEADLQTTLDDILYFTSTASQKLSPIK